MNNYHSYIIGVKSRHCFRKQKLNDSPRLNWSNSVRAGHGTHYATVRLFWFVLFFSNSHVS